MTGQHESPSATGLMTPVASQQLPLSRLSVQPAAASSATAVAAQMAGCSLGPTAAASVQVGEEESTMCLRDQLIHSRYTEHRWESLACAPTLNIPASDHLHCSMLLHSQQSVITIMNKQGQG